jgi:glucokinase
MLLAGDVGATNIRIAIFSLKEGLKGSIVEDVYPAQGYKSLENVLKIFLDEHKVGVKAASIVVAGPEIKGRIEGTNIPWVVDRDIISEFLNGIPVRIMNDLEGMSNMIPELSNDQIHPLNQGERIPEAPMVVLAPGTGLGEAYLIWNGEDYQPYPSEGGHADFAPTDLIQAQLFKYLQKKYEHVSYERVCSGKAIPDIYDFLKSIKYAPEPEWLAAQLSDAADPVPSILKAAIDNNRRSELCVAVAKLFVKVVAAEAGNLALKLLANGGVFLGGGIIPRMLSFFHDDFMDSFITKGRLSALMTRFPVYVITHPQPALYGAARVGFSLLEG